MNHLESETWKYVARDGEVTFVIAGDRVRFEAPGGSPRRRTVARHGAS